MNLTRITRNTSAAVVAGVAAIASYSHMRDLAALNGQSDLLANLMPISVDGMLIVSTTVMVSDRVDGRTPRASAKVSFVIGVAASIVANVLAAPDTVLARTISAWPAVALLLVVEMLARTGKVRGAETAGIPAISTPASAMIEPANAEVTAPETLKSFKDSDPRDAAREVYRASVAEGVPLSGAELARRFGKSARWGVERVAEVRRNGTRDLAEVKS